MKTIRRLIHREALGAVTFVTAGFLALFFFFDLVDELRWVGRTGEDGYQLSHALLFVVLSIPSHLYELLPITVLIGTIFVMARLAQSSEFTIMRTSGMGPWRALRTLLTLGGVFVLLTFAVGDYLAPLTDRTAQLIKVRYLGRLTAGATGAWLKERQEDHSFAVNVRALTPNGGMLDVRIFEFDEKGRLASQTRAASGQFGTDGAWTLRRCSAVTLNSKATRTRPAWSTWRAPPCSGRPRSAPTWWRRPCSSLTAWPRWTSFSSSGT